MRCCKGRRRPEFEPFGEVHGADGHVSVSGFDVYVENLEREAGLECGGTGAIQFGVRADEHAATAVTAHKKSEGRPPAISVKEIAILFLKVRFGSPNVEGDAKTRLIPHVDIAVLHDRIW